VTDPRPSPLYARDEQSFVPVRRAGGSAGVLCRYSFGCKVAGLPRAAHGVFAYLFVDELLNP